MTSWPSARWFLVALALAAAPRALAYSSIHPFVGVSGGGLVLPAPVDSYGDMTYTASGAVGLEAGLDSEFGWQLVLHGFFVPAIPGLMSPQYGGAVDARYVLFNPSPQFQPYVSFGLGASTGTNRIGSFIAPIFEAGLGFRWRFLGLFYLGTEAQWIDIRSISLASMAGLEF